MPNKQGFGPVDDPTVVGSPAWQRAQEQHRLGDEQFQQDQTAYQQRLQAGKTPDTLRYEHNRAGQQQTVNDPQVAALLARGDISGAEDLMHAKGYIDPDVRLIERDGKFEITNHMTGLRAGLLIAAGAAGGAAGGAALGGAFAGGGAGGAAAAPTAAGTVPASLVAPGAAATVVPAAPLAGLGGASAATGTGMTLARGLQLGQQASQAARDLERGRTAGRAEEDAANQNYDRTALQLAQFSRGAPAARAGNAVRGDILAGAQPFHVSGEGRNLSSSGGLSPALLSPGTRELGQNMSRQALLSQLGQGGPADPYTTTITPRPEANGVDAGLNAAGYGGMALDLWNSYRGGK